MENKMAMIPLIIHEIKMYDIKYKRNIVVAILSIALAISVAINLLQLLI